MGGYDDFPMIFVSIYSRTARETLIWMVALIIGLTGFFAPTSMAAFIAGDSDYFLWLSPERMPGNYKNSLQPSLY